MLGKTAYRFFLLALFIPMLWACESAAPKKGVSLSIQVELDDWMLELSNHSSDTHFRNALSSAKNNQQDPNKDFLTHFEAAYTTATSQPLTAIFANRSKWTEPIRSDASNKEVLTALRLMANEMISNTVTVLERRLEQIGIEEPTISVDLNQNLIQIELEKPISEERINNFLLVKANLELRETWTNLDLQDELIALNDSLKGPMPDVDAFDTTELGSIDVEDYELGEDVDDIGPLFSVGYVNFAKSNTDQNAAILVAEASNRDTVISFLTGAMAQKVLGLKFGFIRLVWEKTPLKSEDNDKLYYQLYAVKVNGSETSLDGSFITEAFPTPNPSGDGFAIAISMNEEGSKLWRQMTINNVGRQVAIIIDNEVISAPNVNEPIPNGNTSISGGFDEAPMATELANLLVLGSLPCSVVLIDTTGN